MINMEELDQLYDELKEHFSEEQIRDLQLAAQLLGTLDAVVITKSINPDKLAEWLYHEKEHCLPVSKMREIAVECLQHLIVDGLIVDGVPTEEAVQASMYHQQCLAESETIN